MAKGDGDRDDVRPLPPRHAIEVADQLAEEVVGEQFLDDRLQECARPRERRCACSEQPHRTRTKFLAPPLGIVLLFGPSGLFEVLIDVNDGMTDLAHGCTSTNFRTRDVRSRANNCGGPGPPARLRCVGEKTARGCARTASDQGQ
jgi:hypothetical protein